LDGFSTNELGSASHQAAGEKEGRKEGRKERKKESKERPRRLNESCQGRQTLLRGHEENMGRGTKTLRNVRVKTER